MICEICGQDAGSQQCCPACEMNLILYEEVQLIAMAYERNEMTAEQRDQALKKLEALYPTS